MGALVQRFLNQDQCSADGRSRLGRGELDARIQIFIIQYQCSALELRDCSDALRKGREGGGVSRGCVKLHVNVLQVKEAFLRENLVL
jgi:hypothetical protein